MPKFGFALPQPPSVQLPLLSCLLGTCQTLFFLLGLPVTLSCHSVQFPVSFYKSVWSSLTIFPSPPGLLCCALASEQFCSSSLPWASQSFVGSLRVRNAVFLVSSEPRGNWEVAFVVSRLPWKLVQWQEDGGCLPEWNKTYGFLPWICQLSLLSVSKCYFRCSRSSAVGL